MKAGRPSYLLIPFALVGFAVVFSACKKEPLPKLVMNNASWGSTSVNGGDVTSVCLNKSKDDGPHGPNSPFKTKIWGDEFDGPGTTYPSADPTCYSDDTMARCSNRLDWFGDASNAHCSSYDLTHLRGLNKCAWTLWSGYSFWDNSGKQAYSPNSVQLRQDSQAGSGVLSLQINVNNNATGGCSNGGSLTGCSILAGGVDSAPRDGMVTGTQVQQGRVAMRAKLPSQQMGYPALWMWQTQGGADGHIGEIDLWESPRNFMTEYTRGYAHFHDWFTGYTGGARSIGYDILVNYGEYHEFGVERTADSLKFYVDDCYTGLVKNGDMSTGKNAGTLEINSLPEFLIMGLSATGAALDSASTAASINGQEMLIDYVRVYGP